MDPELKEQFCEHYRKYYFYILKRTLSLIRDEGIARDVTDEVFYKIVIELEKGNRNVLNVRYVARMATNLCIDYLRRQSTHRTVELCEESLDVTHAVNGATLASGSIYLRQLFQKLPKKLFEIAIYRLVDGFTLDEIVELTGLSKRTLRRRLKKILARLRGEWNQPVR